MTMRRTASRIELLTESTMPRASTLICGAVMLNAFTMWFMAVVSKSKSKSKSLSESRLNSRFRPLSLRGAGKVSVSVCSFFSRTTTTFRVVLSRCRIAWR